MSLQEQHVAKMEAQIAKMEAQMSSADPMSLQQQYVAKMEAQISAWTAKLAVMKAKLDEAEVQGRHEFHKQIDASQRQHEVASQQLDELKQAGEEAWESLRAGVETVWKDLATSIHGEK